MGGGAAVQSRPHRHPAAAFQPGPVWPALTRAAASASTAGATPSQYVWHGAGNGRLARQALDKMIMRQAGRPSKPAAPTREDLVTLPPQDLGPRWRVAASPRPEGRRRRGGQAAVCAQARHRPQYTTSASSTAKPSDTAGVRQTASPTAQSTSPMRPQDRHTAWWWLSPTRVS